MLCKYLVTNYLEFKTLKIEFQFEKVEKNLTDLFYYTVTGLTCPFKHKENSMYTMRAKVNLSQSSTFTFHVIKIYLCIPIVYSL